MSGIGDFGAGLTGTLDTLGKVLSQQFNLGSNKNTAVGIAQNGLPAISQELGDFANQVDWSAERSYTEEGAFRTDYYNYHPKIREIVMQEPSVTVLVKKRMFASLSENNRPDLMDAHERLLYKATKVLFANKCAQIAAMEGLSKITQVSAEIGSVDYHLMPILFSLTSTLDQFGLFPNFVDIVGRVYEIIALSDDAQYTTWVTNLPTAFSTAYAQGTGVIEFTNVSQLSTTTSLQFAGGKFDVSFNDPYQLMLITNLDIEQALSDTVNKFYNNSFLQLGQSSLSDTIAQQQQQLNSQRSSRGAQPIIFNINAGAFLGKNVEAIIDGIGFEINFNANAASNLFGIGSASSQTQIDPAALFGSSAIGENGLTQDEASLFSNIISQIYLQQSLTQTTRSQAFAISQDSKLDLNGVRQKLRLQYSGELVIQPMDSISIYIQSKKQIDRSVAGGLSSAFTGLGFLQGIQNITYNIRDILNIYNGSSIEKDVIVGSDFPNWLWLAMRSQITGDKKGAHVFGGIVDNTSSTWSNGVFTARASGGDNAKYFDYGVVNYKPSIDVYNGPLFDPLTPFKLEFDSLTGVQTTQTPKLLDENASLFNSAFVKDKNGAFAGMASSQELYLTQDAERPQNTNVRRVFYDPDGFVYRWKEGIATLPTFGSSFDANPSTSNTPAIQTEPFAGQDIMNILSLLITGEPYNFNTFYKAAIQYENYSIDPLTGEPSAHSYFRGLQDDLKRRNFIYGNFVPFKLLTIDEASVAKLFQQQTTANSFNSQLQSLLAQRANLYDQLSWLGSANTQDTAAIKDQLNGLNVQINSQLVSLSTALNSINSTIQIVGNDISFDYDSDGLNSGDKTRLDPVTRQELRRKLAFLTRRLAWKVRNNEDPNYLIVDDTYDKDSDIQIFQHAFASPELFKSEYITVADKIKNVLNTLDLEGFCNTQGHIEIRNKKYNRMPSSVFFKMLQLNQTLGIQIYPQFLDDLYINQINDVFSTVETLEDEIRLFCLILGLQTDDDCTSFIQSMGNTSGIQTVSPTSATFTFLTVEATGKVWTALSDIASLQSQPDFLISEIGNELSTFRQQANINAFFIGSVSNFINDFAPSSVISQSSNSSSSSQVQAFINVSDVTSSSRYTMIVQRLQMNTGMTFDINQYLTNTNQQRITPTQGSSGPANSIRLSASDVLQIVNQIASRISQRVKELQTAVKALTNIQENTQLSQGSGGVGADPLGNQLLLPGLYNTTGIPKPLEHMIEDESYDDLGPGAGSRYVIHNYDIINLNINVQKPEFSAIEVVGTFGDFFLDNNQLPQDLNGIYSSNSSGGNAMNTVVAVDYDLWRMFGIHLPQSISAPFLTDPQNQGPMYAVSRLTRARKSIFHGSVEIIGNEYQQPGEVVYLENLDKLYYVESVIHNFNYGSGFTTRMELSYGHNPGEYIPTPLDVIGKIFYRNKDITNLTHKRQDSAFSEQHVGTFVSYSAGNLSDTDTFAIGSFGDSNRATLSNLIAQASAALASGSYGGNQSMVAQLEIRAYYNSEEGTFSTPELGNVQFAQSISDYLIGASNLSGLTNPLGQTKNPNNLSAFASQISVVKVDAGQEGEHRYPSGKAFALARTIVDQVTPGADFDLSGASLQTQIDLALYQYVVDCWITFTPNPGY